MNKVLITGGGGYIGSVLSRKLLANGYKVTILDNKFRKIDNLIDLTVNKNLTIINSSILDKFVVETAKKDCDIVVHCAALVGEPICAKMPELAVETNVKGTEIICSALPHKPLIFCSTGSVYGELGDTCTEESGVNPVSLYAKTKLEAEKIVRDYNSLIYRFATAYGPSPNFRLDLLVNDLVYQAIKNKTLVIFQADFKRTFCHVYDIAESLLFAIKNFENMKYKVYNVGNENGNWSKRQLAEFVSSKTGCKVFYSESGYKDPDVRNYHCSFERINSAGWKAEISMEEGISQLISAVKLLDLKTRYHMV